MVALVATFLFAIHPLHTEVVANVKSRDEILALLLMLLTLVAALRSFDTRSRVAQIAVPILGFLACMAKEYGITLVGLIPLMLVLFRSASWRTALRSVVWMGGAASIYLAIRGSVVGFSSVESTELLNNPYLLATSQEKWASKLFVLLKYLGLLCWPHPLAADYSYNQIPYRSFTDPEVWIAILVYAGLVAGAVILIRRRHWLGFALAFYLVPLLLVSNLLVDIGATMGERLVYQSSFGFVLALAFAAERWLGRAALVALGMLLLALGGFQIVRRNADWKNDDTLFLRDVTVVPNAAMANSNAGRAHIVRSASAATPEERDRELEQALRLLTRAIELHPGFVDAWFNLASLYEQLGRFDEMEAAWSRARELFPGHPNFANYDPVLAGAFANLGEQALAAGDPAAARAHLEKALRHQANLPAVWLSLGQACLALADTTCARASWERALALDPDLVQARTGLQSLPAASGVPDR